MTTSVCLEIKVIIQSSWILLCHFLDSRYLAKTDIALFAPTDKAIYHFPLAFDIDFSPVAIIRWCHGPNESSKSSCLQSNKKKIQVQWIEDYKSCVALYRKKNEAPTIHYVVAMVPLALVVRTTMEMEEGEMILPI